jgi:Rrf2 family iron-sulfur cluster assembly transcriptional regulator
MRLQLSRKGNYAVLAVLRLARTGEATTAEIAAAEDIPASSLTHVLAALARSGVVVSSPGRGGGYRLPWPPERITLRQIVEAVDGPLGEPRCLLDQLPCRTQVLCEVHDRWVRVQGQITKTLEATTIAALLDCPRRPQSTRHPSV